MNAATNPLAFLCHLAFGFSTSIDSILRQDMYGIYSSLTYLLPHGEHSKVGSPRGAVLQVGKGDVARIYCLAHSLDRC